jgi:hypothetical protein
MLFNLFLNFTRNKPVVNQSATPYISVFGNMTTGSQQTFVQIAWQSASANSGFFTNGSTYPTFPATPTILDVQKISVFMLFTWYFAMKNKSDDVNCKRQNYTTIIKTLKNK